MKSCCVQKICNIGYDGEETLLAEYSNDERSTNPALNTTQVLGGPAQIEEAPLEEAIAAPREMGIKFDDVI
jgi:hypothetical protein